MMNTKGRLATILIALAFFGCKGPLQTSAASMGDGVSGEPAGSGGGNRVAQITDPALGNMAAFGVTIPANWKFQGVLLENTGTACSSVTSPVWRATSPDGLSRAEIMPPVSWVFGTGPKVGEDQKDRSCLQLNDEPKTAQELLKLVAKTMKVTYVADVPVPEEMNAKAQEQAQAGAAKALADAQAQAYRPGNLALPKSTLELAMAAVGFNTGKVIIKGRLTTYMNCTETTTAGATTFPKWSGQGPVPGLVKGPPSTEDKCTARVLYIAGPESEYAGLIREWDTPGMGEKVDLAWRNERGKRMWQNNNSAIQGAEGRMNVLLQQTQHTMAVQKEMNDQFNASIQQQGADAREQTREGMVARSTAASDVVDYALNQQTVMDTNTGQVYKLPNQVTVSGALQQVHGNGTP
ncbi:MAG TPA: hypothetical protein VGG56_11200 [Terracidiphilus sp.]